MSYLTLYPADHRYVWYFSALHTTPSQNPDNKVAEDMFMKIAKAYEALTDPQVHMIWYERGRAGDHEHEHEHEHICYDRQRQP